MNDEQKAVVKIDGDPSGLTESLSRSAKEIEHAMEGVESLQKHIAQNDKARLDALSKSSDLTKGHMEALNRLSKATEREVFSQEERVRLQEQYLQGLREESELTERVSQTASKMGRGKTSDKRSAFRTNQEAQRALRDFDGIFSEFVKNVQKGVKRNVVSGPQNIKFDTRYGAHVHRASDSAQDTMDRFEARDALARIKNQYAMDKRTISDIGRSAKGATETLDNSRDAGEYITGKRYQNARRSYSRAYEALYGDNRNNLTNTKARRNTAEILRANAKEEQKKIQNALNGNTEKAGKYAGQNVDKLKDQLGLQQEIVTTQNMEIDALDKQIRQLSELKEQYKALGESLSKTNYVAPNRQENPLKYAIYNNPGRFLAGVIGAPIATMGAYMKNGMSIIDQDRQYTRNIGASAGTYNSNPIRRSAEMAGQSYGFSGQQMLQAQSAYLSGAGYQGADDLNEAGIRSNLFARLNGASLEEGNQLTSTYSGNVNGANAQSLKQFQQTFYGAIKQAGLDKYGKSQMTALTSLASTVASNNGGVLTQNQMENLALTQSALASSGEKSLMGQNGAQTMATLDTKLRTANSDSAMQFLLTAGNPSEFNGSAKGYANLLKASQDGISNPETLQTAINGWEKTVGANTRGMSEDDQNAYFGNFFGVNRKTAGAIRRVAQQDGFSKMTSGQYKKALQEQGLSAEEADKVTQQKSDDATSDKAGANLEKASTQVGEFGNNIKNTALNLVGANSTLLLFISAVASATVALGSMAVQAKAGQMLKNSMATPVDMAEGGNGKFGKVTGKMSQGRSVTRKLPGSVVNSVEDVAQTESNLAKSGGFFTSKFGDKLAEGGRASRMLGTVDRGIGAVGSVASKGTSLVSKGTAMLGATKLGGGILKGASAIGSVGSKAVGTVGKVVGKVAGPLALLGNAMEVAGNVGTLTDKSTSKQQKNSATGGLIGTGIGGTIGGIIGSVVPGAGTVIGTSVGASIGNWAGQSIGGLFKGKQSSTTSNESALADKRLQAEKLRQQNVKNDDAVVDKWGRIKSPFENFQQSGTKTKSADSSTSPFENAKANQEGGKKSKGATGDQVEVHVTGTIKHEGTVETAEGLSASISGDTGIPANLFSILGANETTRK